MTQQLVKSRPLVGCLLGAAVLLAGAAGAEAQLVRAGEVALELASGEQLSYLGVDLLEMETWLCGLSVLPTVRDPRLVVANDGGNTGRALGLDVVFAAESGDGTQIAVDVLPGELALAGPTPLETGCGPWSYRLSLDRGATVAASTFSLVRNRPLSRAGAFSGVVSLAATLELTPVGGGPTLSRPYSLSLDLAGTWGLAGLGGGKGWTAPPPSASNLVLLAQKTASGWEASQQVATATTLEDPNPGQLVLQPTADRMGWMSSPQLI